ncbi:hypothetical protein PoB_004659000 [Plakobranchus ocellatus]|uniref:Uncharacterized protein n=1 Tax=Plakobranchus ocellatus TaxID=259542 RepID=A0AAV4BM05_9GAST|nr:hypothetical protein PoB_004659000 [Plakobranchus ocellatus]
MFQYVWGLSNNEKKVFVRGMVERDVPKEKKLGESRRSLTMKYYLEVNKGSKLRVCKSFFLSTTGLCNRWLHNALTEEIEQTKEATRNLVEPQEGTKRLQQWLIDLPKLPSHYSRQSSKKPYLEPTFRSYLELYRRSVVDMEELGQKAMSRFKVMEEFHAMGLSLFHPRKDRCDICVGFEEKTVEEVVYNAHRTVSILQRRYGYELRYLLFPIVCMECRVQSGRKKILQTDLASSGPNMLSNATY